MEVSHTSGHSKRNAGRREQSRATVSSTSQVPTTRPGSGPRGVSVNRHRTPSPPAQTQLRRMGTTQQRLPNSLYDETNRREIGSGVFSYQMYDQVGCHGVNKNPCLPRKESVQRLPNSLYYETNRREIGSGVFSYQMYDQVGCHGVNKNPCLPRKESVQRLPNSLYYETNRREIGSGVFSYQMYDQVGCHGVNKNPCLPRKESVERKPERGESLHSFENANRLTDCGNHKQNIVDAENQQKSLRSSHYNETFVTLINIRNNCCVNALLQTLFIIPEYSNLLLNCQQKGLLIKDKNHILYHLEKVFHHLQNKTKRTVSPDKFIKSLRSNHINVGSQMDAEELFRSLCNLLEDQLKKTPYSKFVDDLHVLTTEEYQICLKCQNEFQQIGHMLTIPLSLYEPSSGKCYKNVMNSLNGFFELQTLDDENKCYCDQCGEKTATQHGCRVHSWPEILCLQLKRFDFVASLRKTFINNTFMEFTESIGLNNCEKELHNLKNIPQYKLISVIVHKDFVSFGHYYVYIKNIEKRKWHCFNDERVTEATWEDVKKTFGSSSSSDQSEFQMNGVAYLLFYKRMDQSFQ